MAQDILGEDLKRQLESIDPNSSFIFIIRPKRDSGLEKAVVPRLTRRSPEEIAAIQQKAKESIQPICDYLDQIGTQYQALERLGIVNATLKPGQVYPLAEQPYVGSITSDFKMGLIE